MELVKSSVDNSLSFSNDVPTTSILNPNSKVFVPLLQNDFSYRTQEKFHVLNPLAGSFHPPNFLGTSPECPELAKNLESVECNLSGLSLDAAIPLFLMLHP